MNNIILVGRLTKNPELRTTQTQKNVCEFTLAVNRIGSEDADFITCQVWEKQAENLCKYQGKGSQIAVSGSLRVNAYKNEQGESRYKTYVLASNIEYLGSKSDATLEIETEEVDPFSDYELTKEGVSTLVDDDDLPF